MCKLLKWVLLLIFPGFIFSQATAQGDTYAIVVGISQYHYIKPLHYADRDAELFGDMLRTTTGGNIKEENLFLLKNDSANAGNFWSSMYRIINKPLKKGDRVYIYFAGHGDAIKGLNEYYLLLSDCQPANDINNYMLSLGVIDMYRLKNRIGLLTNRGVEVMLILDACRTNELPGGYASQVFNQNIIETNVGEISMLATGPGQVSVEDASFGSGHGLFTFNLIDALSGRADEEQQGNRDKNISMGELKEWVSTQVKQGSEKLRVQQYPVFSFTSNEDVFGKVDNAFSDAWKEWKNLSNNSSFGYANRVTRNNNNQIADTALLGLYNKFNTALNKSSLWGTHSADEYYEKMNGRFPAERVTEDARYALAANFINFAQQKINLYLEGKDALSLQVMLEKNDSIRTPGFLKDEYEKLIKVDSEKWTIAGLMVEKAGRLLSSASDSSILQELRPRISFMLARGYLMMEKENTLEFDQALVHARNSYHADSSAAYTAECLGLLFAYQASWQYYRRYRKIENFLGVNRARLDSARYYFKKAITIAPRWANAWKNIGLKYYRNYVPDSTLKYLNKAIELNPADITTYLLAGEVMKWYHPDTSLYYYKTALSKAPLSEKSRIYVKIADAFNYYYDKKTWQQVPKFDSILIYAKKALLHNPMNPEALKFAADVHKHYQRDDSAIIYYTKAISISPALETAYPGLVSIYIKRKQMDSLLYYRKKLFVADTTNPRAAMALGEHFDQHTVRTDSAIHYYKLAQKGFYPDDIGSERLGYLLMNRDSSDTLALTYFSIPLLRMTGGWRPYYNIACYYANRGEKEMAIIYLEKVLEKRMRNRDLLEKEPYFKNIRNTKPFEELLKKYF